MSYEENVRAAAAALKRGEDANWELARLTFEVCGPPGSGRHGNVGFTPLRVWSCDVREASGRKFSQPTAGYYRDVWERFGDYQGDHQMSWTEAYAEIRGGTVGERMVEADFKRALTNASPEQKREVFSTLASQPEVIREALRDDQTRWEIQSASRKIEVEKYPIKPEVVREVEDSTLDRRMFLADIADKVDQWARELNDIREFLEWSGDVDQQRRWVTRQALARLIVAATSCRDVLPESYVAYADTA